MYSHVFKLRIHEFEVFFLMRLAFIGLHWSFWPLLAFDHFSRLRVVFLRKNNRQTTTFHHSDFPNSFHMRSGILAHSAMFWTIWQLRAAVEHSLSLSQNSPIS